jgi:hypothetical protein
MSDCSAALAVDGEVVRSRAPSEWVSMRWSMPVIQTGRADHCRALSPAARTIAAAPSVIGGSV